jgi:uncharacterized protein YecE (DUF72 family)
VPVLVGTSGWHYQHWKSCFYPPRLPASRWLEHYAGRFGTVEINNAFYRLPEAATFGMWARTLPDDFVVAVKMSRYLTHVKRLRDPTEPVGRFMERARELGPKLGPVLLQLPPNLRIDLAALDQVLAAFPPPVRIATELRHPSWFVPETRQLLESRRAALCVANTSGGLGFNSPVWRTADWGYVRFHAGRARPAGCYGPTALRTWAGRLAEIWPDRSDLFVYFNNDGHGCAPRDARRFALAVSRAGLTPTRVPGPRETPLCG